MIGGEIRGVKYKMNVERANELERLPNEPKEAVTEPVAESIDSAEAVLSDDASPSVELPTPATDQAPQMAELADSSAQPVFDSVEVTTATGQPTDNASLISGETATVVAAEQHAKTEPSAAEASVVEAVAAASQTETPPAEAAADEEEPVIRPSKRRSKAAKTEKPKAKRRAKKSETLPDPGDGSGYEAPYAVEGGESEEAQWYAVHCYSGYENKVKHNLEQRIETMGMAGKILEVVVPTEDEIEVRDGKRRTVERRVFPGYVMVHMKMSEDSWHVVRNTPGVTRFVGMGNRPQPLSPQEVDQILRRMEAEAPKIKVNFRVGQKVRITDGPFADFMGLVDKIDTERAKVTVLVSFFGRETPVELDFLQVERM